MTGRELSAIYRAVAKALAWCEIDQDAKNKVIHAVCHELKAHDARFQPDKFTEAAWGADW